MTHNFDCQARNIDLVVTVHNPDEGLINAGQ
jgi:hypothetical protein